MARYFNKNTSNYMNVGVAAIGNLLNGASKITAVAKCYNVDGFTPGATTNNTIMHIKIAANAGVFMGVDIVTSTPNAKLKVGGRSVTTDAFQSVNSATTISTSTQYSFGGMLDIGGDTISVYVNGALDAGPTAVTFANSTWTLGSPTVDDGIGSNGVAPPSLVDLQFGGYISEVAIWDDDIGAAGHDAYHDGYSPLLIMPHKLVAYWPLLGNASPETERINAKSGTITGTLSKQPHPRIIMPHRRMARRFTTAAGASANGPLIGAGRLMGSILRGGRLAA